MAIELHNDAPVVKCNLERDELKKHILDVIKTAKPPKTIAIHGTWGTGKTSLMAQLYTDLGGDYKFKPATKVKSDRKTQVVWFDAWQYQHEENILVPLLHEIRAQLSWYYKFLDRSKETIVPGLMAALQSIDLTLSKVVSIKGFGEKFVKNEQEYLKERFANELNSEMLRKMLHEAINQLLGLDKIVANVKNTDGRKLVIFIDDLDRCEPEAAFKVLEAIKIYLNLDNCLFVLGMDMYEVERMLGTKYEKVYQTKDDPSGQNGARLRNHARLYLEKICQDVFHLPALTNDQRKKYFMSLIEGVKTQGTAASVSLYHQIRVCVDDFNFLPPFPRSIKMLANTILSHHQRVTIFYKDENRTRSFLILSYLYTFHHELYQLIYLYQHKDFYNLAFLEYCKDGKQFLNEKGKHQVLESVLLPEERRFSGVTSADVQNDQNPIYPHESLRQWLWIRNMVIANQTIPEPVLNYLKF